MANGIEDTPAFSPFDPGFRDDPYPVLRALRERDPVHWSPLGFWILTRHADVETVLRAPHFALAADAGTRRFPPGSRIGKVCADAFLFRNPPAHTRLRAPVGRVFSPGRVARLAARLDQVVAELLAGLGESGETDLVNALAYPLPLAMICELVGIPSEDMASIRAWSEALCPTLDPVVSSETAAQLDRAVAEFGDYVLEHADAKRRNPREDLLSTLAEARERGEASDDELVASCVLILTAGHETTSNLIASGLWSLLRSPAELERLRRDPALVPTAVEEMLRTESPITMFLRWPQRDVKIEGVEIAEGDAVAVHIGAANRDPAVFADPDRFDAGRAENRHVAFGAGLHFCLGAALARAEAAAALRGLLACTDSFELAERPVWKPTVTVRGPQALRVRFRRKD
jgi:cytochrome P450